MLGQFCSFILKTPRAQNAERAERVCWRFNAVTAFFGEGFDLGQILVSAADLTFSEPLSTFSEPGFGRRFDFLGAGFEFKGIDFN